MDQNVHQQHIPNRVGGLACRCGAQFDLFDVPIRWVGDVGETPCISVSGDGTGSDGVVLFGAGRGWAILGRNGPIGGAIGATEPPLPFTWVTAMPDVRVVSPRPQS